MNDVQNSWIRLCLLNFPTQFPAIPARRIRVRLAPPRSARFTSLCRLPDGEPVPYSLGNDGELNAELDELAAFDMLAAGYEPC